MTAALAANGTDVLRALRAALGEDRVLDSPVALRAYAYDAMGEKYPPLAVLVPRGTAEVSRALAIAAAHGVPVVGRGAGTNLSGGSITTAGGLVVNFARMNRILAVDTANRRATVEPGVTNQALQDALDPLGYFYPPDPSSGKVSTIGGNIAENAGGPRCLKYGVTVNHLLAVEVVLYGGAVVNLGTAAGEHPGLDLTGLVCGSEGTLGLVTRATVGILPLPPVQRTLLAVFASLEACGAAVAEIIAARVLPATLELLDREIMRVVRESGFDAFPAAAEAALIIEVDGAGDAPDGDARTCAAICSRHGARVRVAAAEAERQSLWQGRKAAAGAIARLTTYFWTQDVTVPRPHLPAMIRLVQAIAGKYGLRIPMVAHAGDGNFHPIIPYDPGRPDEVERVRAADREILAGCVELGGSVTGEHGVGVEKLVGMSIMHSKQQLDYMHRVRRSFDPAGGMNPGKKIPAASSGF